MARPLLRSFLWGLASALALPPVHFLPALLFSVPALLRLLGDARNWKHAALMAWLFGFGLNLAGLYWITEPILTEVSTFWWLVPFADPLLAFAVAFYTIIPVLACRAVPAGFGRLLIFAGAWVASDLLRQFAFSGFPWNLWGTDWAIPGRIGDVFIQPASLIGVHGLTFFTVLLAGLPLFGRRGLVALVAALILWGGYGLTRLSRLLPDTNVTVAMLQPNSPVPGLFDQASLESRWQQILSMSAAAKNAHATTIIWPEAASPWLLSTDTAARQQLAAVTGTLPILAGSVRMAAEGDYRNALVVTDGPGPAAAFYDKWKLVPFGEYTPSWIPVKITPGSGFTPGPGPRTLHVPGLPAFAPLICYEAIFSGQIIDRTDRPQWIVNVTDDAWFGNSAGPRQHFADARLRAVEEGLPLARDANSGITAMFDSFGHVVAALPLGGTGVLVVKLPGFFTWTVYSKFGLFVPGLLASLSILIGILIARLGIGNILRKSIKPSI